MGKVFCSDCKYCMAEHENDVDSKCQHPENGIYSWYGVVFNLTCSEKNKDNDCIWFEHWKGIE
jgi:hypothetical protein